MKKSYAIGLAIIFAVILCGVTVLLISEKKKSKEQEKELNQMTAEMEFNKQQSLEEFEDLAVEYESFHVKPGNDSLLVMIENQKEKIKKLIEELRTVKATNAHRIRQLKGELVSIRAVLKVYITKVDSLNNINHSLKRENKSVQKKYEEVVQTAKQLEERATELDKKITLASILEATNIRVGYLNDKGKKTKSLKRISLFEICFQISKNQTATTGMKTAFVRISDPEGNLLKSPNNNLFPFEDKEIEFSCKKEIEYTGANLPVCVYYDVKEKLEKGTYTINIFVDGNLIGSDTFYLN